MNYELDPEQIKGYADKVMAAIREDASNGVVPYTTRSFAALHSFVDANMYLEEAGQPFDGGDESVAVANAITDQVHERLMDGELSGGRSWRVTWDVSDQHQRVVTENELRDRFSLNPDDPISIDTLADPDEAIADLITDDSWHGTMGHSVEDVEEEPDRELDVDEAAAVGLDCTGRDGHPNFPHRWSTLTRQQQAILRKLGGSATKAAAAFTDEQVQKAGGPTVMTVADMVAHDAAAGLPGFTRVGPERGTIAWAEQVLADVPTYAKGTVRAAARMVVVALAEVIEAKGTSAGELELVRSVAAKLGGRS